MDELETALRRTVEKDHGESLRASDAYALVWQTNPPSTEAEAEIRLLIDSTTDFDSYNVRTTFVSWAGDMELHCTAEGRERA